MYYYAISPDALLSQIVSIPSPGANIKFILRLDVEIELNLSGYGSFSFNSSNYSG